MSCHKAVVVITEKAHCFHDYIYIMPILPLSFPIVSVILKILNQAPEKIPEKVPWMMCFEQKPVPKQDYIVQTKIVVAMIP